MTTLTIMKLNSYLGSPGSNAGPVNKEKSHSTNTTDLILIKWPFLSLSQCHQMFKDPIFFNKLNVCIEIEKM